MCINISLIEGSYKDCVPLGSLGEDCASDISHEKGEGRALQRVIEFP